VPDLVAKAKTMSENAVIRRITEHAIRLQKRIVLPETQDLRVLQAAEIIRGRQYARVTLLGPPDRVREQAKLNNVDLSGVEVLDPAADPHRDEYVDRLHEKRKAKGMTRQQAAEMLANYVYYGAMMVGADRMDGMVAGSNCPTADTVRAALFGVGLQKGIKTLSGCSIMCTRAADLGVDGALLFADTGVVPEPTAEQLADIAISAALQCRALLQVEPAVAMLSFSSKGSAHSPAVEKVVEATRLANTRRGDLNIDGELQADAALLPSIARRKAKDSPVAGKANVLIFPDLSSGNVGYKLVERLGDAIALGPLLMGLAKPVNDLSRGCSVEDIVLVTAITAVQAG